MATEIPAGKEDHDYHLNFQYTKVDGSILPHLLLFGIQLLALGSPVFPGRRTIFSAAIIYLAITANLNRFTDDPGLAQFFSLAWPHYLSVLEKILFSKDPGPEVALWRVDKPQAEALGYTGLSLQKLNWAFIIWFNLRGIRWNFQVKNIPHGPNPGSSKWHFLFWQSVRFVKTLLVVDILSQIVLRIFYTTPNGTIGTVNTKYLTTRDPDLTRSFAKVCIMGGVPYFFMNIQYILGSILLVALNISKPEDWPPFFGNISDVTTVRYFWGNFWHQMLRKAVNSFTGAYVDFLRMPRGTNIRKYTQLWCSFAISGIMHSVAIYLIPAPLNITLWERTVGFFQFFISQAAVITFEDFIQWVWRKQFPSSNPGTRWKTLFGYVWVTCWLWYSLPFALDIMLKLKNMQEPILPFTLFGPYINAYVPIGGY